MVLNDNLIDFFKKHNLYDEATFKYITKHSIMIDYKDPDQREFAGCHYVLNGDKTVKDILVFLPYVYDDITMLVSIHELTHAIMTYKNRNKKFKTDKTSETLPILFEKLYLLECQNEDAIKFSEYMDEGRIQCEEYRFSLKVVSKLLENYNYDLKNTTRQIKKLSKRIK